MPDRRRFSSNRTPSIQAPLAGSVNPPSSGSTPSLKDATSGTTPDLVYRPIVILEPHLDDFDLDDDSRDDDSRDDEILRSEKFVVWRQSSSGLLLVGDVLAPNESTALQKLPRRTRSDDLLSVEAHGLGLGAVFKRGRNYLLALYSRSGQLNRTQRLNPHALQAIELKHEVDLNRDGRVGFRRSRRSGALFSAVEAGVPVQPFQSFGVPADREPAQVRQSVLAAAAEDQLLGVAPLGLVPDSMA